MSDNNNPVDETMHKGGIDTGYEGKEEKPEVSGKFWTVKKMETMMGSGGTVLQVLCNGEPRGILDLREDEVEWISKRISGSQPSSPVKE